MSLCLYSFTSDTLITTVLRHQNHQSVGILGKNATWGYSPAMSSRSWRCLDSGPFQPLPHDFSAPFHHCLKVRGRGQKLHVIPQDTNEQKNELMLRKIRPTVFDFVLFNVSCVSSLQTCEITNHYLIANSILEALIKSSEKDLLIFAIFKTPCNSKRSFLFV